MNGVREFRIGERWLTSVGRPVTIVEVFTREPDGRQTISYRYREQGRVYTRAADMTHGWPRVL